jgi:5-methylcytosine-specific restriction protein A
MAIRAAFLSAHPLCVMCLIKKRVSPATELDHIVALMHGGGEQDNYQALCHDCHQDKTSRDKGHAVRANTGIDGWPL